MKYYIREQLVYRNNRYMSIPKVDFVTVFVPIVSAGLIVQGYTSFGIFGIAFWRVWMLARFRATARLKRTVRELYYDPSTKLITMHLNETGKDPIVARVSQVEFKPPIHATSKVAMIPISVNEGRRASYSNTSKPEIYELHIYTHLPMVLNKHLFIALTSMNHDELDKYEMLSEDKPDN